MIQENITKAVRASLNSLGIEEENIALEHPGDAHNGDFSSNIALILGKTLKKNPKDLAEEIVRNIKEIPEVEKIETAGQGFINFHLSKDFFASAIENVLKKEEAWGSNNALTGKKVMIEYTSPNLFKPLHVGNLMSNIIGESLARLAEISGAEVKRFNYPSDIGLTVAKAVWGIRQSQADPDDIQALGAAYQDGNTAYENNEGAKKEIEEINKKLYDQSDENLNGIYKKGRATSLRHLLEICRILGTKQFDFEFFESQSGPRGLKVVLDHIKDGIFEKSDGAVIFRGEPHGLHTEVFVNSQGLPTYGAKDVGVASYKREIFPFDLSLIETGAEQKRYFEIVFKASEAIYPDLAGKQKHIGHGLLTLTTGKMSSRKGNVLTGESIIESLREAALNKVGERSLEGEKITTADAVAVSAIKYQVLKQTTGRNIIFDPDKSLSFEGNSGPYLQYTHARILSLLEKGKSEEVKEKVATGEEITDIDRLLYRFPEVVERAAKEYEPHYVANYLTELAGAFNSWYGQGKILDGTKHTEHKLALARAVAITLRNGLWLLGIQAPKRM